MANAFGRLLKDYPQYGKKVGDVVPVTTNGNVADWKAWSIGIVPSEDVVKLSIGTDVKILGDVNTSVPSDLISVLKKEKKANEVTPNEETKTTEEPSKPNWVLVGGIVLVGFFLLKK